MRNKFLFANAVRKGSIGLACFFIWGFLMLPFRTASGKLAFAYDAEEAKKVADEMKEYGFQDVTTKEGLKFRIPSDMPIETRGGIVAPVPFEEYLYLKFKKIEERVTEVDKKLAEIDKKLGHLDDKLIVIKKTMDDQAAAPAAPKKA